MTFRQLWLRPTFIIAIIIILMIGSICRVKKLWRGPSRDPVLFINTVFEPESYLEKDIDLR